MSNFEPKDLNFETVQQIFKECMPVENESKNICAVQLQQLMNGFPSDSEPIYFDIDKLEENKQNVRYLLGQLHTVHKGDTFLKLSDILKKYNGYYWAKDKVASIILLHLGMGTQHFSAPLASSLSCLIFEKIDPTLSPKDPRFNEWYKLYEEKVLRKK